MADERLRLLAELKDNMSAGLKKINAELKQTKRTPGMEQAQKWFKDFGASAKDLEKSATRVSGVMGAIGVGGLGAAASLAVLTRQFKELGDHVFTMKRLGQETGMTIDQVKRWEYVGQSFRVPVQQMDAALKALGDQMVDFRRRRGELFGQMNQIAPEEASKLLGMKDANAQFQEILRWLSTIKDTALRNRWAKEFFGTDDLDALLTNGLPELEKAIARAKLKVAPITPEMQKQADALAQSIVDLNQSWENFELKTGPAFLKALTSIVDKASQFFNPDRSAIEKTQREGGARGERERIDERNKAREGVGEGPSKEGWDAIERGLAKKSSYTGSGGLLHQTAFEDSPSPSSFGLEGTIASGTKIGVLAAFREWAAQSDAEKGGGFTKASFETGNPGGGGGRRGGGAGGGGKDEGGEAPPGLFGAIMRAEGTNNKDPYNTVLGNGKYGLPSKPLTSMTLAEAYQFGLTVRHNPKNPYNSSALGAFQIVGSTMKDAAKALGLDMNTAHFDEQTQRRMATWIAHNQGLGAWAGFSTHPRELADARRAMAGGDTAGSGAGSMPNVAGGSSYPGHINGQLKIGDESYRFGSGGVRGSSTIPFGDYPITPDGIGAWGRAHGALGINNDKIWDKALGRMRLGIEMHAGHTASLITEGCVAFEQSQWPKVKSRVLEMVHKYGHAYLHVGKDGASITPTPSLADEARKARNADKSASPDGSIEAHVHIHDGQVKGASAKSSGVVKPPRVQLRRGPTMTEPSISA